ncbi:hypothetical protein N780_11715 [Pontibacillus chungwhensis BH030062]|uniref:AraC family transcriptional regulator n=1 Tax=Pontibacillus chungwhensis BH030062 TaxID=1385513 RepID=A0A0A2V2G0_9BACI|nr:response regulator [Pontibacillus chungwhensis]KGP92996.1 hypothetical protein N780_11715 [Pontibacillus chungwhensis BH030062]
MFKVITVDDEKLIKRSISALIHKNETGFQIVGEANNGEEAMELVSTYHPHLIITDIRMPKLNGLDFIQKVRSVDHQVKFIVLSGYDEFIYAQQALRYGVSDFLLKPIKPHLFLSTLDTVYKEIQQEHPSYFERQERLGLINSSAKEISNLVWMLEEEKLVETISEVHKVLQDKGFATSLTKDFYQDLFTNIKTKLENRTSYILPSHTAFPIETDLLPDHLSTHCKQWINFLKQKRNIGHKANILSAARYIEANFKESTLTLNEVANIVDMSPSYFSMEFKKEMGESYKQFVTKLRIDKAKILLKNPIYKTYEIADTIGYVDYPHFTKTFKKITGYTPTEYRKRVGVE